MDEQLKAILLGDLLSGQRAAHMVALQGVMNHQTSAHFLDMTLSRDATEVSFPEAAAMQSVLAGQNPGNFGALNTANRTPSDAGVATK